jgi:hypothetical protein
VPANVTIDFRGEKKLHADPFAVINKSSRLIQAATVGTGSFDLESVVNSTNRAIRAIWLSLATWLQDFPKRTSQGNDIALWTASYGGYYAPALYDFTMLQNRAIQENNSVAGKVPQIRFSSIGMSNACVDPAIELPAYLEIAYNNTYDLQLMNLSSYLSGRKAWESSIGCKAQIQHCRSNVADLLSQYLGNNASTNTICHNANVFCGKNIVNLVLPSGRSFFDIGHRLYYLTRPTLPTYLGYLKRADVQAALGVAVNFTNQATEIAYVFSTTGDNIQRDYLQSLGRVLDDRVRVSLVYGDRDYACNCKLYSVLFFRGKNLNYTLVFKITNYCLGLGGEAVSMAIPYRHTSMFLRAGYVPVDRLETDEIKSEIPKAYVRQYGNLSFTRVLDCGHTINTDIPSIGFHVFNRTVYSVDVASGRVNLRREQSYSSTGLSSTWHIRNQLPADADEEEGMCYVLDLSNCSGRQRTEYLNGRARVKNYWIVGYDDGTCCVNPVEPCGRILDGSQPVGGNLETISRSSLWPLAWPTTVPVLAMGSVLLIVLYTGMRMLCSPLFR